MATKLNLVNSMYSLLRISGLTVQPTPEDLEGALWRLEDMMSEYEQDTLCVGFNFEENPNGNTESGVKRSFHTMISSNLGMLMLNDFGKSATEELAKLATTSYNSAVSKVARDRLKGVSYPARMPRGSGNRRFNRWRRFYPPTINPETSCANVEMYAGDIDDFYENFLTYLSVTGGTIANYTIKASDNLTIVSDSLNASSDQVDYRIEAQNALNRSASTGIVTIVATTSLGRVETRERLFVIKARAQNA